MHRESESNGVEWDSSHDARKLTSTLGLFIYGSWQSRSRALTQLRPWKGNSAKVNWLDKRVVSEETVWTLDSGEMENKVTASNDDGHEHNTYGTAQGKLSNVNSRVLLFL
jgi:hypothetical protein